MSRPPRARDSVLDAFEMILISEGERAATIEAIARVAGVSKGGLLYHFASKEALEEGLIARLDELVDEDITAITTASEGRIGYFLRSSIMQGTPLDRAIAATSRLAQAGSTAASGSLREIRVKWEDAIRPDVRDQAALDLIMLVSDGLYFNNALDDAAIPGPVPTGEALNALIALVEGATRP